MTLPAAEPLEPSSRAPHEDQVRRDVMGREERFDRCCETLNPRGSWKRQGDDERLVLSFPPQSTDRPTEHYSPATVTPVDVDRLRLLQFDQGLVDGAETGPERRSHAPHGRQPIARYNPEEFLRHPPA